jgi:hypothetical protein
MTAAEWRARVMKELGAILLATATLIGCVSNPPPREIRGSQTTQCTDPGGWAPWIGGISASGSRAFCAGRPRQQAP